MLDSNKKVYKKVQSYLNIDCVRGKIKYMHTYVCVYIYIADPILQSLTIVSIK